MDAAYVDAFLLPSVAALEKMARTTVRVGKVARLTRSLADDALSVVIGLNGSLSGSVILSFDRRIAWALAGRILQEPLGPEAHKDVLAVLAELANTIVGNATGRLYELGVREGITPPMVIMGSEVSFDFSAAVKSVLVPLETEVGDLEMIVSLAGRNT